MIAHSFWNLKILVKIYLNAQYIICKKCKRSFNINILLSEGHSGRFHGHLCNHRPRTMKTPFLMMCISLVTAYWVLICQNTIIRKPCSGRIFFIILVIKIICSLLLWCLFDLSRKSEQRRNLLTFPDAWLFCFLTLFVKKVCLKYIHLPRGQKSLGFLDVQWFSSNFQNSLFVITFMLLCFFFLFSYHVNSKLLFMST